jgi:ankyrin repeat protein
MLWEECYTDAEIQTAMDNLPKDLSETYNRCLARITQKHNRLAQKVLYWVCVAIKPFEAAQMQEALTVDPNSGPVDSKNMLPIKEIIKFCPHLVIRDTNDRIHLTHASVSQFLEERSAQVSRLWGDYTLNDARAELGDLCMTHLLSLASVERRESDRGQVDVSQFLQAVKKRVPYAEALGLWTPRTAQVPWPPKLPEASAFSRFARYHWARLTDGIDKSSPSWGKFMKFALEQHFSLRVHPWESIGQSAESHCVSGLGWAIANRHQPLFSLLLDTNEPKMNKSVFNIPLYHYKNIPLLHLAARNDFPSAVGHLVRLSKHPLLDHNRRLALHHAAESGSLRAMGLLLPRLSTSINDRDVDGYTPLHLAAMNKRNGMIELLIDRGASLSVTDKKERIPLFYAVENFDCSTVQALISKGADVNTRDSTLQSPLFVAAEGLNASAVALLMCHSADAEVRDKYGYGALDVAASSFLRTVVSRRTAGEQVTQALYLAIQHGNVSVVDCLLRLGANLNWRLDQAPSPLSLAVRLGNFAIAELLADGWTSTDDGSDNTEELPSSRARLYRDRLIIRALEIGKYLNYRLFHQAAQAGRTDDLISLVDNDERRPFDISSMMAIIACIFGHAEAINALNDQGYIYDASSIMRAAESLGVDSLSTDLAERLFRPDRLRMVDDPDGALRLLLHIAREFGRAEVEATIFNIIWRIPSPTPEAIDNRHIVGYLKDPDPL